MVSVSQSDRLTEQPGEMQLGETDRLGLDDALAVSDDNKTGYLADAFSKSDECKCSLHK